MSQTYDVSLNPEKSIIIETEISGGTTDYERLKNLPSINGVELKGDLSGEDLGIVFPDTSNFATKEDLETKADKSEIPDVKEFATKIELEQATINKADKSEIPDVSEFATKSDLENKADKSEIPTIPTKVSEFENDVGYLTEHQDISGLATKDELNDYALKTDIPTKTSDLINDSDFITSEAVKNTTKMLDDEHKNILLSNGTYDGKDVEDGFVFTSPDGKLVGFDKTLNPGGDWGTSSQTDQEYVETRGVYGNGAIIIPAGIYNTVNKSTDKGVTWTFHRNVNLPSYATTGSSNYFYNGKQFVGLNGGRLYTSTDGVSWSSTGTNLSQSAGVAFRNGRYVTRDGRSIKYSDDGLNWSTATADVSTDVSLSESDNGFMFIGGYTVVVSEDGENWTVYSKPSGNGRQCAGGNGTWVIVDSVPTSNSSNKVFYSKDNGATWNTTYTPSQRIWSGLSWCGDRFFMVGYNSDVYAYSFDGVTWIEGKMPAYAKWYTVTYADGTIVVTTKTQTNVAYASFHPFYEYGLTDLSFNKAEVIATVQGKTTISELTAQTTLANNTIFRANETSSVELLIPETIEDDFICEVDFTSGSTATAFTMVDTVKWTGDDITDGSFVPVGNKRYNLIFWYDGVGLNAVSRGVE